jgi:chromosome segregation ATPase
MCFACRKFKELRGNIATALSKAFQRYLRLRHHMGSVEVNYKEKRLALEVRLEGQKEGTNNMKDLSGGERSYTSLAFILALGRVGVNPPFHALDEFDVYMDQVNRRLAFMFLLEFQLQHPDRQLLLFTPLDPSVVNDAKEQVAAKYGQLPDDFIKVHCLPRPRGQRQDED